MPNYPSGQVQYGGSCNLEDIHVIQISLYEQVIQFLLHGKQAFVYLSE
jgi:hypothetical protein